MAAQHEQTNGVRFGSAIHRQCSHLILPDKPPSFAERHGRRTDLLCAKSHGIAQGTTRRATVLRNNGAIDGFMRSGDVGMGLCVCALQPSARTPTQARLLPTERPAPKRPSARGIPRRKSFQIPTVTHALRLAAAREDLHLTRLNLCIRRNLVPLGDLEESEAAE